LEIYLENNAPDVPSFVGECAKESDSHPTELVLIADADDHVAKASEILTHLYEKCAENIKAKVDTTGPNKEIAKLNEELENEKSKIEKWVAG
jgi:hypothetical protein